MRVLSLLLWTTRSHTRCSFRAITCVISSVLLDRRPKDFDGAQFGVRADFARYLYQLQCGPALLTAGSWTAIRLHLAGRLTSPLCQRCFSCPETKDHRHWYCDDNFDLLQPLLDKYPDLRVDLLPACLRRCGLIPHYIFAPWARDVALYLVAVAERATTVLAKQRGLFTVAGDYGDPTSPT